MSIRMSMTVVGYVQNCPTQAYTRKFQVLCNTHWSWIANQQCFDFVDFLAANTLSCHWHWLAMTHMHLIGREKFQTCKTLNFVTILIFTYQIRCSMPIWPSLSSVTSASLQVDVSRFTSRSGSKQYGRISPTGSNKETTDDASPSLTSAKNLKVLNHFQYPKKNWIYHFLPLCAH